MKKFARLSQGTAVRHAALTSLLSRSLAIGLSNKPLDAPPTRMDSCTPQHICQAYDVYFNGVKQTLCSVADMERGYITRFVRGNGRTPVGTECETLFGKVQIVPRGTAPKLGE